MNIRAIASALLLSTLPAASFAQTPASDPAPATPVRDTDAALTCTQIADEAAELSASMGKEGEPGVLGRLGAVARSGAAMLIPGAGLAMAGADLATSSGRDREKAETNAAKDRWNYLNGIYMGRGCNPEGQSAPVPGNAPTRAPSAAPAPQIQAGSPLL